MASKALFTSTIKDWTVNLRNNDPCCSGKPGDEQKSILRSVESHTGCSVHPERQAHSLKALRHGYEKQSSYGCFKNTPYSKEGVLRDIARTTDCALIRLTLRRPLQAVSGGRSLSRASKPSAPEQQRLRRLARW